MKLPRAVLPLILATGSVFLTACGTPTKPLYAWGSYQEQVNAHFKGSDPQAQIKALEADAQKAKAVDAALPPGFRAHLGLLYGDAGNTQQFVAGLEQEKAAFPESAGFMDYLLRKFKAKQ